MFPDYFKYLADNIYPYISEVLCSMNIKVSVVTIIQFITIIIVPLYSKPHTNTHKYTHTYTHTHSPIEDYR